MSSIAPPSSQSQTSGLATIRCGCRRGENSVPHPPRPLRVPGHAIWPDKHASHLLGADERHSPVILPTVHAHFFMISSSTARPGWSISATSTWCWPSYGSITYSSNTPSVHSVNVGWFTWGMSSRQTASPWTSRRSEPYWSGCYHTLCVPSERS
jgi:hypothetical protein